ncbi:putative glycolipid-binding domain-containing protein [Lolliginicoccus levis]|uniref:putative glycolipid-binding domain-containing protein n=1 Tax=Lolliginicoccus levis TaxID=2919542 RepID=UPI0024200746|nr:putative glycolipid-binding domain-containing protein [Lolliginicoccus levis]
MTNPVSEPTSWPAVLTWKSTSAPRMESTRIQLSGRRVKASGRLIGGTCEDHESFSASYDLVTDDAGITRRLSLRTTTARGERVLSVSRDREGHWTVHEGTTSNRSRFGGALDVDVILSPFFNALPIRRLGMQHEAGDEQVSVVYVSLPDLTVREESLTYSAGPEGIHVISPVASATVTVDGDGFVIDYPGLGERI